VISLSISHIWANTGQQIHPSSKVGDPNLDKWDTAKVLKKFKYHYRKTLWEIDSDITLHVVQHDVDFMQHVDDNYLDATLTPLPIAPVLSKSNEEKAPFNLDGKLLFRINHFMENNVHSIQEVIDKNLLQLSTKVNDLVKENKEIKEENREFREQMEIMKKRVEFLESKLSNSNTDDLK